MHGALMIVLGLAAGVLAGLFGIGGGVIMVLGLASLARLPFTVATGTSLAAMLLPVGALGVWVYWRNGNVDFKAAALLSPPEDRDKADIPKLIERLFLVKPEQLQIDKVQLLTADVDTTGKRARTKFGTDVKLLNSAELRHPEVMLYWRKAQDGKWYMDLASSLQ